MTTREVAVIKDRETGDINELRDKKLADSTARTTSGDVQTTDSIRMLDTSGNEVYIARDSFMAAVKSCLGNIINSSTLKTEAPKTLVLDSGGDLGAVQPSTLASVLGVPLGICRYTLGIGAGLSYTIPNYHKADIIAICNNSAGGDSTALYFFNVALYKGVYVGVDFSGGIVTNTGSATQNYTILQIKTTLS